MRAIELAIGQELEGVVTRRERRGKMVQRI
jgi:hypothetical protein